MSTEPHILVATAEPCTEPGPGGAPCADCVEHPELTYAIECPGIEAGGCRIYWECREKHSDDDVDRMHEEEPVHGVEHVWIGGLGWATPGAHCYVQQADAMTDAASYVATKPGRYPVTWETDDPGDITLHLVTARPTGGDAPREH